MNIIALDTTTFYGTIGILSGSSVLAEHRSREESTHAEELFLRLEALLKKSGLCSDDIEGMAVCIGPGSFTGLRVGLAAAKGFAFGRKIPIASVSSLETLALNVKSWRGSVVPLIDARRDEAYGMAGHFEHGLFVSDLKPCVMSPEWWGRYLERTSSPLLLGDGIVKYRDRIVSGRLSSVEIPGGDIDFPMAAHIAELAREKLTTGGDDLKTLVPFYIRHSDAEIGLRGNP